MLNLIVWIFLLFDVNQWIVDDNIVACLDSIVLLLLKEIVEYIYLIGYYISSLFREQQMRECQKQ